MNDHRKQQVIAKLIAARAELEDVLNISTPRARYDSPILPDATRTKIAAMIPNDAFAPFVHPGTLG